MGANSVSENYDLVIRNATIVDGTGSAPFSGDIGIVGKTIAKVGRIDAKGREEFDARGYVVTPGFVDIHTHYDGQATWSQRLNPSSGHGVTTVITGNCGVGFAPCRPEDRERLIHLMEGVEDIPEVVLAEGLPWAWTSFPEFLDFLDTRQFDVDVGVQLPHAPLRVFVMGERGANRDPATPQDIAKMSALAEEAMRAGAIGFSSSRSYAHKASDGSQTPSFAAAEAELNGIARGVKAAGKGVLQIISDFEDVDAEFGIIRRMVEDSGRPMSMTVMQYPQWPDRWRQILDRIESASDAGLPVKGQVIGRPVGVLIGLEASFNPFSFCPSYLAIADRPFAERLELMRDPELRKAIIAEFPTTSWQPVSQALINLDNMFELAEQPVYEPGPEDSIAAIARKKGVEPAEYAYDLLLKDGGKTIIYIPAGNFVGYDTKAMEEMLWHKDTVLGLGDGGAHCGLVCDASYPTYMLTRWLGGTAAATLPAVVKALSSETAQTVGLRDRGIIAPGYRADLNVIDLDAIELKRPEIIYDLPHGAGRLTQRAKGYKATMVAGQWTYRDGEPTGATPGRLVRGEQQADRELQVTTPNHA